MTKNKTSLSSNRYLITPSLINSWLYIWNCVDNVRESEKDTTCLEDKKLDAQKKPKEDFIKTLKRFQAQLLQNTRQPQKLSETKEQTFVCSFVSLIQEIQGHQLFRYRYKRCRQYS